MSCTLNASAQNDFIIGADWISPHPHISPICDCIHDPKQIPWDLIKEAGLNAGIIYASKNHAYDADVINIFRSPEIPSGFRIILDRFTSGSGYYLRQFVKDSRRWKYQVEDYLRSSLGDFNPLLSTLIGNRIIDTHALSSASAELRWDLQFQISSDLEPNAVAAIPSIPVTQGWIVNDLVQRKDHPISNTYYRCKLRMRVNHTNFPIPAGTPIIRIEIRDGNQVISNQIIGENDVNAFSDTLYHEISLRDEISIPNNFNIGIWWYGAVECYIDYIAFDNTRSLKKADNLFQKMYDSDIEKEITLFVNEPNLWRYKINDEPDFDEWLADGYMQRYISERSQKQKETFSWYVNRQFYLQPHTAKEFLVHSSQPQIMTYMYMPHDTIPYFDSSSYTSSYQSNYDGEFAQHLRWHAQLQNDSHIPMYHTVKSFFDGCARDPITLRPTSRIYSIYELRMNVNMGIAYGAKGIFYHLFWSFTDTSGNCGSRRMCRYEGLIDEIGKPITSDDFGDNRWEEVKRINQKLHLLSNTLMNLQWRNTLSAHLPHSKELLRHVVTTDQQINQRYVEIGFFSDRNDSTLPPDYLYVVNRRTKRDENRNVTIKLGSVYQGRWLVRNILTQKEWIVQQINSNENDDSLGGFTDSIDPGDGWLYSLEPIITHIDSNDAVHISAEKFFVVIENYPQPSSSTVNISCFIPEASDVEIGVYDWLGLRVAMLTKGNIIRGKYSFTFDGKALPSGVYFILTTANKLVSVNKMIIYR